MPEIVCHNSCQPFAVVADRGIVHINTPELSCQGFRCCIGVQCQMHIIVSGVGIPDGAEYVPVRIVPYKGYAAGKQIGLKGIRQQIHILLFVSAVYIGIPLLGGRT